MGLYSGRYGAIDGISTVRQFSLSDQQAPAKAVASNTKQGVIRRPGVHSWSGSYQGFGAIPAVQPGVPFSFEGYGAPTGGVFGSNGQRYRGTAVANSVQVMWNWKTAEILGHTVNFAGHLELVIEDDVAVVDASEPDILQNPGTKAQWAPSPTFSSFADLPNLVQAQLTLSCQLQAYVNSSTYVNGKVWTGQEPGAPFDWTVALTQEDENRVTDIFDKGDDVALKLFVDDTRFWLLEFGHVRDFSGLNVNRETGAILQRTINIDMNAYYGDYGVVLDPDSNQWWPGAES